MHFGKYSGVYTTPGCHCSTPIGRSLRFMSKRKQVCDVPMSKCADLHGRPLNVSAVVSYYISNTVRAALAVESATEFVRTSATAVMKQIVSKYPYEERKGEHSEHNLKSESDVIGREAVELLQERVEIAGAKILTFAFNELNYSSEIASSLLKRQQV